MAKKKEDDFLTGLLNAPKNLATGLGDIVAGFKTGVDRPEQRERDIASQEARTEGQELQNRGRQITNALGVLSLDPTGKIIPFEAQANFLRKDLSALGFGASLDKLDGAAIQRRIEAGGKSKGIEALTTDQLLGNSKKIDERVEAAEDLGDESLVQTLTALKEKNKAQILKNEELVESTKTVAEDLNPLEKALKGIFGRGKKGTPVKLRTETTVGPALPTTATPITEAEAPSRAKPAQPTTGTEGKGFQAQVQQFNKGRTQKITVRNRQLRSLLSKSDPEFVQGALERIADGRQSEEQILAFFQAQAKKRQR